jgi:hypothetical protein
VQTTSKPRKFYRIVAIAMIIAGSALLLISVSNIFNRQTICQDNLVLDRGDILSEPLSATCIDPTYEIAPSSNDFIMIILAICLVAFGGSILGMIVRL